MTKIKYWLSILAISVVLLTGSLAVSPIAIADDDDDESTQDCVEECIDAFEDAMDVCDDLESEKYDGCVLEALRALQNCIGGGGDDPRDPKKFAVAPSEPRGCIGKVAPGL